MAITAEEAQALSEDDLAEMLASREVGIENRKPLPLPPVGYRGKSKKLVRGLAKERAEYDIVKAEDEFRDLFPPDLVNFRERNKGETTFSVEWDAFPLRGAQIFVSSNGGSTFVEAAHDDHHQFSGLSAGTEYTFEGYVIRRGRPSTAVSFTASTESADDKPAPPSGLEATAFPGNIIIVEWEVEVNHTYEVQFNNEAWATPISQNAHSFIGVISGTHTIRVRATHNGVVGDPASITVTVT